MEQNRVDSVDRAEPSRAEQASLLSALCALLSVVLSVCCLCPNEELLPPGLLYPNHPWPFFGPSPGPKVEDNHKNRALRLAGFFITNSNSLLLSPPAPPLLSASPFLALFSFSHCLPPPSPPPDVPPSLADYSHLARLQSRSRSQDQPVLHLSSHRPRPSLTQTLLLRLACSCACRPNRTPTPTPPPTTTTTHIASPTSHQHKHCLALPCPLLHKSLCHLCPPSLPLARPIAVRLALPQTGFPHLRYLCGDTHHSIPVGTQTSLSPCSTHLVETQPTTLSSALYCSDPVSQLPLAVHS
jgi:hypothetical protein